MRLEGELSTAENFTVHAINGATGCGRIDFGVNGVGYSLRISAADLRFLAESFGNCLAEADLPGLDPQVMVRQGYEVLADADV